MKHTLETSSICVLSVILFSFILTQPVLLNAQISQDTIQFKIETKRGVPFIGANLDYDFYDGTTYSLDGQLTSDSLGIIWFLNPGNEIIDDLLLRFNSTEVMETGVDFADVEILREMVLGSDVDCQDIMDYISSNDEFTDGFTTLDVVLMIKNLLYDVAIPNNLGKFKFKFNLINSDLDLEEWIPFSGNFSTHSINEIVGYYELDFNNSINYTPPISTPSLEIGTENKYFQPGDTIQVSFKADTSVEYNVFQFCLRHEGLKLINTDHPFYQYDSVLTRVNYSHDNNYYSNVDLKFESTIEGELKDILQLGRCKMKNEYYYGDCYEPGQIKLVIDDASIMEELETEDLIYIYPNPTSTLLHIDFDHQQYADLTMKIYDSLGRVRGQYGHTESLYPNGLEAGLYFIEFWSNKRRVVTKRFIKQ